MDEEDFLESCERVARGARWLDCEFPGWERKVDVAILDISDPDRCVCGQVIPLDDITGTYGYGKACDMLSTPARTYGYGFAESCDGDQWVTLIKERFNTGALSDG